MSTLALKSPHISADRLRTLIRSGKPVRITENGKTVAKLEPVLPKPSRQKPVTRSRNPKLGMSAAAWLEKNLPPGPGMPDFDVGEYVRLARASEG